MCGDPRVDVVKAAARAGRRQWTAWASDAELVTRHTATIRARWTEQWPDPDALAAEAARLWPTTKAAKPDHGLVGAVLAWLWERVGPNGATLAALTAAIVEARQLGRTAALAALHAAGFTIPAGTQALDALDQAQTATMTANARGTLTASIRGAIGRVAAGIAAAITAGADVAARIRDLIASAGWVDRLTATEAWKSINAAAATTYGWAGITRAEWLTANDAQVCAPCDALEAEGAQPIDRFPQPPLHPRCRCVLYPTAVPATALPGVVLADLAAA